MFCFFKNKERFEADMKTKKQRKHKRTDKNGQEN